MTHFWVRGRLSFYTLISITLSNVTCTPFEDRDLREILIIGFLEELSAETFAKAPVSDPCVCFECCGKEAGGDECMFVCGPGQRLVPSCTKEVVC